MEPWFLCSKDCVVNSRSKTTTACETKVSVVSADFYTLNLKKHNFLQPLEDAKVSFCNTKYKDIQMYEKLNWHYLEIDAFIKVANIGVRTDSRNDIRHNITMLVNHGRNFYTNFLGQISGPSSSCQYHAIGQNLGKKQKTMYSNSTSF